MSKESVQVSLQFTADAKQAKAELASLQKNLTEVINSAGKDNPLGLTKEIQESAVAATKLKVQLQDATNAKTGKLDLTKFNDSLKRSGMSIEDVKKHLYNLGPTGQEAFQTLSHSIMTAEAPLKRTSKLMQDLKQSIANAAKWQLSSSIIHGFMGSVQTAYHYAQDLNESLNKIRIVTGQNTDQMAKFATQANKAAQALSTTTTRYTESALIYAQQGLDEGQIQQRTDTTIKMAQVTGDAAQDVSSYMTAIWNNFDDGSKSLEHYADVITALGASTASSSSEIAQGLSQFAPIANTVGLSYEYATSALATLVSTTRQSADLIGNSLKTIFSRLQGLSLGETLEDGVDLNKYSKALNAVGVQVVDQNGELRQMDDILDDLASRWDNLTNAQQMALAQTVAGTRQYNQLISLMDNWGKMQENILTAKGSEGALSEQAEIYQESWQAASDRVRAALEEIYDDLIDDDFFITMLDGFKSILNVVDDLIKGLGGMPGVLLLISNMMSQMFSKEMAQSINDQLFNLRQRTTGKSEAEELRKQTIQAAYPAISQEMKDVMGTTLADSYDRQVYAHQRLLQSAEQLSQEERDRYSQLLDQQEILENRLKTEAESLQIAREKRLETEQQMTAEELGMTDDSSKQQELYKTRQQMILQTEQYVQAQEKAKQVNAEYSEAYAKGPVSPDLINRQQAAFQNLRNTQNALNQTILEYIKLKEKVALLDEKESLQKQIVTTKQETQDMGNKIAELRTKQKQAESQGDWTAADNYSKQLSDATEQWNLLYEKFNELKKQAKEVKTEIQKIDQAAPSAYASQVQNIKEKGLVADATIEAQHAETVKNIEGSAEVASKSLDEFLNNAKGNALEYGEALTRVFQGITSAASVITSLKNVFKIWSQDDVSTIEKLTSTITTLGIIIPTAVRAYQGLTDAKMIDFIITKGANSLRNKEIIMQKLSTLATEEQNKALATQIVLQKILNPLFLVGTAAIAALGVAIYAGVKAYNANAEAAKKAAEAAKALKEESEKTKRELESIKSAFDSYNSAIKALEDCTRGTEEWYNALHKVNEEVLNILANSPELAGQIQTVREDGALRIVNQDQIIKQAEARAQKASYANLIGNIGESVASFNLDKESFRKDFHSIAYGQRTEAIFNNLEYYASLSEEEFKEQAKVIGMSTSEIHNFYERTKSLAESSKNLNAQIENTSKLVAEQQLEEYGEAEKAIGAETYARTIQTITETYEETIKGFSRWARSGNQEVIDLWKKYQSASGIKYELAGNAVQGSGASRSLAYIDAEGKEQTIGYKVIAETIAASDALQALKLSADAAAEVLNNIQEGETFKRSDIENWIATGNFELSTEAAIQELKGKTLKDILGSEGVQQLAKAKEISVKTLETNFKNAVNAIDFNSIAKTITRSAGEAFTKDRDKFKDFTYSAQKSIADIYEKAFNVSGKAGLDNIRDAFAELSEDVNIGDFANKIKNIDWNTVQLSDFKDILGEVDNAVYATGGPLETFIAYMREIAGVAESFDSASENYNKYAKIKKGVEDTGKIDKEQYDELDPLLQAQFARLKDGSYQFIGQLEEFISKIDNLADQGFQNIITNEEANIKKLQQIEKETGGKSLQDLKGAGTAIRAGNRFGYDDNTKNKAGTQLDILDALNVKEVDGKSIEQLKADLTEGWLKQEELDNIAKAYETAIDNAEKFEDLIVRTGKEADEAKVAIMAGAESMAEMMSSQYFDTREGMNTETIKAMQAYAASTEEGKQALVEFNKELLKAGEDQAKVAEATQKFQKALQKIDAKKAAENIKTLKNNYKEATSAFEQTKALQGIKKELESVFGKGITEEWIKSHEDLIDEWTEGGEKAEEIAKQFATDLLKTRKESLTKILDEGGENLVANLKDYAMTNLDMTVNQAEDFANRINGTTEQIRANFDALNGVEIHADGTADFSNLIQACADGKISAEQLASDLAALRLSNVQIQANGELIPTPPTDIDGFIQWWNQYASSFSENISATGQVPAEAAPKMTNTGGGGGGGGGAKKHSEKKSDKDKERYHTITNQLEDLEAAYDRVSKAKDRAFGKDKLALMDAEIKALEDIINAQDVYLAEIEKNLQIDKAGMEQALKDVFGDKLQFEYDASGNITNFDEIQDEMYKLYNKNASKYTEDSEAWKKFEKRYELIEEMIAKYEETYDLLRDTADERDDKINDILDKQLESFKYEIELEINVSEDSLALLEHQLENIEDKAFNAAQAMQLLSQKAEILQDQAKTNKDALDGLLARRLNKGQIEDFYRGTLDLNQDFGFTDEEISSIKEYRDNLLDLNSSLRDTRKQIEEQLLKAFDEFNEELDYSIGRIEHYQSVLDSYKNIIGIVGKKTLGLDEAAIDGLNQAIYESSKNRVKASKDSLDAIKKLRQDAEAELQKVAASGGDTEWLEKQVKEFTKAEQEAQEQLMSDWEAALENIVSEFEESLERAAQKFNDAIYAGGGLEGLSTELERNKNFNEDQLEDYEKIYELSKLNREINKSIDDTKAIAGKQKLKDLQEKINKAQEEGVKLSKYDLEYLQKEYDLRMAEIALEDARNAKDTVRLTKDAEGNWAYTYTQNADAVNDAQQKYEDALYAMQKTSTDYIKNMQDKIIATSREMQEAVAEINREDYNSTEEWMAERERVTNLYLAQIEKQQAAQEKAIENNKLLYETDWADYSKITDYQQSAWEDYMAAYENTPLGKIMSGTTDMLTTITEAMQQYLQETAEAQLKLEEQVNEVNKEADEEFTLDKFSESLAAVVSSIKNDSDEAAEAVEGMAQRMSEELGGLLNDTTTWLDSYGAAIDDIIEQNTKLIESFNNLIKGASLPEGITVSYSLLKQAPANAETPSGFDTGGYTGSWGPEGKMAVLHEKEIVLNANDTANMLDALNITRSIMASLDQFARMANFGLSGFSLPTPNVSQATEQNVHITAEFPGVSNHLEIEEALTNLMNTASQYANR